LVNDVSYERFIDSFGELVNAPVILLNPYKKILACSKHFTKIRQVRALSPLATLERGYAVVQQADGGVVLAPDELDVGTAFSVRVAGGRFGAARTESDPYEPGAADAAPTTGASGTGEPS
jgi:hypothetical protein